MLVAPMAYERATVSVSNSVVGVLADWSFSAPEIDQSDIAWITPHGGDLVFSIDGSNPAVEDGHNLVDGETFALFGRPNIKNFRALGIAGAVDVTITLLTTGS